MTENILETVNIVLRGLAACEDRVIADHARGIIIRLATNDIDLPTISL